MTVQPYRFLVRGGTAAAMAALNEVPLDRETCLETDTLKIKYGDGVTAYNDLPYAYNLPAELVLLAALSSTPFGRSLLEKPDASALRTAAGLGTLATLNAINGGNWSGADLAIVDGGTGASSASAARTNLGLVIGTDVQAQSAMLSTLAGKSTTGTGNIVLSDAPTFSGNITAVRARFNNGNAASPTISFNNAIDTGLFLAGTELHVTVGGVDILGIYSTGLFMTVGKRFILDANLSYFVSPAADELDAVAGNTLVQHMTAAGTRFDKPINFPPIAAPSAPASGWTQYVDNADGKVKLKSSAGVVVVLTP